MWAVLVLFLGVSGTWGAQNVLEGYLSETHNVVTEDGYILELLRIQDSSRPVSDARKVVFLMHCLATGSDSFLYGGSEYAIGYNLAKAGFDVWMGNARGNSYSRQHVSLNPDSSSAKFFDFSYEEIGLKDLPAMFDYVLSKTGQEQLHYIGHAQGGTVFLVLNSLSTAYHSKIASAYLLAPMGYEDNFPNAVIKKYCKKIDSTYSTLLFTGQVELTPPALFIPLVGRFVGTNLPPTLFKGGAVKQLVHYCQNIRDGLFRKFMYTSAKNEELYGSTIPPSYDLSKINIDVSIFYSVGDATQSETDQLAMAKAMANAKTYKVSRETFSHLDFIVGQDAKELVTDTIIKSIKNS